MPPAAKGRPTGSVTKPWKDALNLALKRIDTSDGQPYLTRVAESVVAAAINGDMQAAKEIGDRLDGKSTQPLTGENDGPIKLTVEWSKSPGS